MKAVGRVVALAFLLAPAVTAPVTAQAWKFDFGINGGYSWLTKMLDEEQTGLPDGTVGQNVSIAPGILGGAQLTFWPSTKFGVRLNGRYASRDLKGSDAPDDFDALEDVNLWGGTADLLIRFGSPRDEFAGMEMLPYLALGIGGKWHNPAGDDFNCAETGGDSFSCGIFNPGVAPTPGPTFAMKDGVVLAGLVGLGADFRLSRNFALRAEVSDQIFKPKVFVATAPVPPATDFSTTGDDVAKMVHEIGGQLGLHFLFGVPRAAEVAVVVPPPTPAPVPVQPAPEPPAPVSESVSVCVVDPTTGAGIRTQSALFYPARGDTVVLVNSREVPLRDAFGNVFVASNADWYIRGQPLTLMIGRERIEYVTYGTAHMVQASDLAFLGTVNGVPVYADRDDVSDIRDELEDLNQAQRGADLARLMTEHRNLRQELADVKVVYVPLQPTGCVFQPLQLQEQVRKNREQ
jgi:hypothetical protein